MMTTTNQTVTTTTVELPGKREFTAHLYRTADGEPTDLILSVGYGHETGWRNRAGQLCLPPESIGDICRALEALEASNG